MVDMGNQVDNILAYLQANQQANGEFRSQCYLPTAPNPIWYYSGPSPFLTGNVLYCLSRMQSPIAQAMYAKGCGFLHSLQEDYALSRYWEHNSPIMEYNVPGDVDDTSLTCYHLTRQGIAFADTRPYFYYNLAPDGMFYTWFLPRVKALSNLGYYAYTVKELVKTRAIFLPNKKIPNNEPISSIYDREAAVDANVLLFLGVNDKTRPTLEKLIRDTLTDNYALQYYDQPFYVHYHLSRLYAEGITELDAVKEKVLSACEAIEFSHQHRENYLQYVFNTLTLLNFGLTDKPIYSQYIEHLITDPMHQSGWLPFKYWTSKQRSWWAGSPEMTAALYAEAIDKNDKL